MHAIRTTILALALLQVRGTVAQEITLARANSTDYAILTETNACENVRFAAWDLARLLKRATGATFPLQQGEKGNECKHVIELGTAHAAALAQARGIKLGHNGAAAFSTETGDIMLTGPDAFGITGAAYDFLEKQLGFRWYSAFGDEYVPNASTLTVKDFCTVVNPPLESRWFLTVGEMTARVRDGDLFLFRNGVNMTANYVYSNVTLPKDCKHLKCEYVSLGGYCHTLFSKVAPHGKDDNFGKHPEWFTFVRNKNDKNGGKRVDSRQLCFSNPELRAVYTTNFMNYVAAQHGRGVFNISAMDVPGPFCECPKCLALCEKYGSKGAPLFDYLAEVGNLMKARWPEAYLSTLVYRRDQTQRPPNELFPPLPDNIIATFAPIDDDFSKSMLHKHNVETAQDLAKWRRLVKHIWAWYYPIPYTTIHPYAGIRRSACDIREMLRNALTGASFEHDVAKDVGANFYDAQLWIFTKLFREPNLDVEKLVREFFAAWYGAAADDVWHYWNELENLREGYDKYVEWNGNMGRLYTPERLKAWKELLDRAETKVVTNARQRFHVQQTRLGLDRLLLSRWTSLQQSKVDFGTVTAKSLHDALIAFYKQCKTMRVGRTERAIESVEEDYLLAGNTMPTPEQFKNLPAKDVCQSFAIRGGTGCKRRPEKDACTHQAVWCDKESVSGRHDLHCWVYDGEGKRTLIDAFIRQKDMVEGKFHLYKLGRTRLTGDCYIAVGSSWYILNSLSDLYVPGVDEKWDIYLSMKFEGPQYFPQSKLPKSRAVFERSILVRARD